MDLFAIDHRQKPDNPAGKCYVHDTTFCQGCPGKGKYVAVVAGEPLSPSLWNVARVGQNACNTRQVFRNGIFIDFAPKGFFAAAGMTS
jgi:hypothetical protein